MDLADRRAQDRAAERAGQVLDDAGRRQVQHHRALRLRQPPLRGQGQRQLLADVAARLVDDRQAIGVGVLREPDVGPDGRDDRGQGPQVPLGRLGGMVVPPVGLAPQDQRLAPQGLPEQDGPQPPAGAVAGVEHDPEPAAADPPRHRRPRATASQVLGQSGSSSVADPPLGVPAGPAELAPLDAVEHGPALGRAQDHPLGLEELQAVVLGRVVRRRDLDPAGRPPVADQPAQRRRGHRPGQQDVAPGRRHGGRHRRDEDRGRDPAVVPDDDRPRPAAGGIGRRELGRDDRVEPVADDPPQPRDARDPGPAHVRPPDPTGPAQRPGDHHSRPSGPPRASPRLPVQSARPPAYPRRSGPGTSFLTGPPGRTPRPADRKGIALPSWTV